MLLNNIFNSSKIKNKKSSSGLPTTRGSSRTAAVKESKVCSSICQRSYNVDMWHFSMLLYALVSLAGNWHQSLPPQRALLERWYYDVLHHDTNVLMLNFSFLFFVAFLLFCYHHKNNVYHSHNHIAFGYLMLFPAQIHPISVWVEIKSDRITADTCVAVHRAQPFLHNYSATHSNLVT